MDQKISNKMTGTQGVGRRFAAGGVFITVIKADHSAKGPDFGTPKMV